MWFLRRTSREKTPPGQTPGQTSGQTSGQVSVEVMLLMAVVTIALVLAFFLVVPGIRDGFVALAEKIIAENP